MSEYVAVKIRALRKHMRATQASLAKRLRITQTAVTAYEAGRCNPRLVVAKRLVKLGVKYEVVMSISKLRGE